MDPRYQLFSIADRTWYEPLARHDDHLSRFSLASCTVPAGWRRGADDVWVGLTPDSDSPTPYGGSRPGRDIELPAQGWKIHISATPANAEETIQKVWTVCRELGLPWKFLRSRFLLMATGSKYAARAASGKVVTIYPSDEIELEKAVNQLEEILAGSEGPYILSDLRWKSGPVYLRYGAFLPMWCEGPEGGRVMAIRDEAGKYVPDVRRPAFTKPSWIDLPAFVAAQMPTVDSSEPLIGRFRVHKALHFSNAGGVYLAEDTDGTQVVLKEARPHAGLDARETDAVTRLRHEHEVLGQLQHHSFVPRVLDYLTAWEHEYLVMEFVDGRTVADWIAREHPLLRHESSQTDRTRFARDVLAVLDETERCLAAIHADGITFGDLHDHNIMVRGDNSVVLLDFELASTVDAEYPAALGAPGFTHLSVKRALDADWFAMGCCRLDALVPLNALRVRKPEVLGQLVEMARTLYPLPAEVFDRILTQLGRAPGLAEQVAATSEAARPPDVVALAGGIRNSATLDRADRLYPADIAVNRPGGSYGLAHGASGVILALHATGESVPPEHVDWLLTTCEDVASDVPPGLYDGLAGAALTLHRLGHRDQAMRLLDVLQDRLPATDMTLLSGRTGIAHLLLDMGDVDAATVMAESIAARLAEPGTLGKPGLLRGWSGPAVLFSRCADETGEERWLTAAQQAIDHDWQWLRLADSGEANLLNDGKLLPYLQGGSAGVALAVLAGPPDIRRSDWQPFLLAVARACAIPLVIQGGLFNGRAGLIYFLAQVARQRPEWAEHVSEQARLLGLHSVQRDGHEVLIGDQLLRLSTDLATGSAGALLALAAIDNPDAALLPGAGIPHKPVPLGAEQVTTCPLGR
jgi:tRNA A-37 threonylcarbamoyl transferase component Bud32